VFWGGDRKKALSLLPPPLPPPPPPGARFEDGALEISFEKRADDG
jgi:hypothetical protein